MTSAFTHCQRLLKVAVGLAQYRLLMPEALAPQVRPGLRRAVRLVQCLVPRARDQDKTASTGARLAAALTRLGPSYIKLGQLLATRPDIVGPALARDLQCLQDKLPPFTVQQAWEILEAEFGSDTDALFVHLGFPVAAASIAQVHKAVIRLEESDDQPSSPAPRTEQTRNPPGADQTGTASAEGDPADAMAGRKTVAVKILRPNIEVKFGQDLSTFAWLAQKIERMSGKARRLEPVKLVQTLADSTAFELDLRLEAAAASEMAERDALRGLVRVPEIKWQHTGKRVLTTEWIDGIPLWDIEALDRAGVDKADLARRVIELFLTQALFDGFFHADMHQGNLMVDEAGNLVALDFGIMGRLDKKSRRYLARIIYGFLTRNYDLLADVHFEAAYVPGHKSRENFAQALRAVGEPVAGRDARTISMARLLDHLFEVTALFDMHLQPQLVLLQKTMVATEGVARNLDSDFNMWETARPVIERWMRQDLGPEGMIDEAREAARMAFGALARLPDMVTGAAAAADMMAKEGLKLHPDTARQLAPKRAGWTPAALALWVIAAALLALVYFEYWY